jgi:superfamily II DNA or RNA helicase
VEFSSGKERMYHSLARMRFINTNYSLTQKVKNWIVKNSNERFILFVSDEKTGKRYGIPMFNSKSKDCSNLENFKNGKIDRLCLIKKASAGVTFPKLQTILITAINSNGETLEQMIGRSLLTDTEKSNIHIFVSNQQFQLKWLEKALSNIDPSHIKWV